MQITFLIIIIIVIVLVAAGAVYYLLWGSKDDHAKSKPGKEDFVDKAEEEIEHIFNDEFREELRNRGRLHFEKIIGENAMFLQQDLQLTTSQLNDYMKQEITRTLQEEFSKYERSINDAKQLALESINKTREAIEQQREVLSQQLQEQVAAEKARIVERFEKNMSDIVNHYILESIGNQIDLSDQLEYIIGDLEANKKAIIEDVNNGS